MGLITLDIETYYDKEYSLTKLSTEAYITDPRFEFILVDLRLEDGKHVSHSGDKKSLREFLFDHRLYEKAWLAHNMMFDGLALAHHFNLYPRMYFDTLQMAQAKLKPYLRSISLFALLKYLNLGVQKGTAVHNMIGRRRESLTPQELRDYTQYCRDDVEGTFRIFQHLKGEFPRSEFEVMDMVMRMYLEPHLELDAKLLEQIYEEAVLNKEKLVDKLPEGVTREDLMSNDKLAAVLESLDVPVPMKVSPATGNPTYAFAKNDPGWKDMVAEYEDDPVVRPILDARLGVKSTLIESRSLRLKTIAETQRKFRVPLRYYAAHSGRLGGMEKLNAQNLNRVDEKKLDKLGQLDRRQLRFAVKAPKHHVVLAADLKQIEARGNAWLSGCTPLLDIFHANGDPYSEFSTIIHKRKITKADVLERFIGKTCILGLGYGMGAPKLQATLRKDDLIYPLETTKYWVDSYRSTYKEIPALWKFCDNALSVMVRGGKVKIGPCMASGNRIELPNGMSIIYPDLRWVRGTKAMPDYEGYVYDFAGETRTLWGGKVVENIVQALARIIIMDNARAIKKYLKLTLALQAHDELVYVVLERHAAKYAEAMNKIMRVPPSWGRGIPVDVEIGFGPTYGDAK